MKQYEMLVESLRLLVWTVQETVLKMKRFLVFVLKASWIHQTGVLISSSITEQLTLTGLFCPAGFHQSAEQTENKSVLFPCVSLPEEIRRIFY